MATIEENATPSFRFKRRKIAHPRRAHLDDDAPAETAAQTPDVPHTTLFRGRRRRQDRIREGAHKAADRNTQAPMQIDRAAEERDQYSGRFIAQTGQVIDRDDKQMAEYVEARLAEQNYRQFGWPIPSHLQGRTLTDRNTSNSSTPTPASDTRMAAGLGKLQEIDLGPEASARNIQRTDEARRRLEGMPPEPAEAESGNTVQPRPPVKRRRWQQRRNSDDLRRDMMVEAVLREAKLEYFDEERAPSPPSDEHQDADDAFYERFRRDYENQESRNQRKPAPPPGPKGVNEPPKGPKLGGSRSARAAMRLQEEQAAKKKR